GEWARQVCGDGVDVGLADPALAGIEQVRVDHGDRHRWIIVGSSGPARRGIHDYHQIYLLAKCLKLPRHLVGDQSAVAHTAQEVWTAETVGAQGGHVVGRHGFDGRWNPSPVRAVLRKGVKGLICVQVSGQFVAIEAAQVEVAVNEEERSPLTGWLDLR